jgi:transcriptional regulator with PAS, ATPase and Fis domain
MDLKTVFSSPILDGIPQPYVVLDRNYQIHAANSLYSRQFKLSQSELIGKRCHLVEHGSEVPCSKIGQECPLERAMQEQAQVRLVNFHPDVSGEEQPYQVTMTPIRDEFGEIIFFGSFIEPVSTDESSPRIHAPRVLVGHSQALRKLTSLLYRAAPTTATILIEGESGVGKECAASYVHQYSNRSQGPFVVVDCGALGESLIESELFGYEKGAFTGAAKRKEGLFEAADGGTLFIDEVGEMPLELQTKLLRVLEMGTVRRLGGTEYIKVDVRIVAATNRDLLEMVREGSFRQDLYYRLAAFPVFMPPLRERKDDIPSITEHFLGMIDDGKEQIPLSDQVMNKLLSYDYPGNIRELRNIIERAVILAVGEPMLPEHVIFPNQVVVRNEAQGVTVSEVMETSSVPVIPDPILNKRRRLTDDLVMEVLTRHAGHRGRAAQELGVSERTLYRHIKKLREE